MALKLDIKNDTLIPSNAFQEWAEKVLTKRGMETSVQIPVIGALFKRNKDLQGKLEELKEKIDAAPAGSDIWFSKMFLWPFGGKITEDAKSYFEELGKKGSLDDLEKAARDANAARQTNGTNLQAACKAALNLLENQTEGLPAAVGALGKALSTPTAAPEAAAVTAESLYALFNAAIQAETEPPAAAGGPISAGPLTKAIGFANSAKDYVNNNPSGKPHLLGKIKAALDKTPVASEIIAILSGATPQVTVEQAKEALKDVAPRVDESRMFSSLDILLESGKITQEDYNRTSKRLLKTSAIINEQAPAPTTPPAPAPRIPTEAEKTAAIAANKVKFDGFVSSIAANCETLATELKGLETLGQNLSKQTVNESLQRKVIKAHIKKRILQEVSGKDSREQLNEFFLIAALLAALTGAIAWATAKISGFFKDSSYGRGTPTYPPQATPQQAAKAAADLGSSVTAGYGPDGVLVDAAGRRVVGKNDSKTKVIGQLDFSVNNLTAALTLFKTIEQEAATATPSPATAGAALGAFLGVTDTGKHTEADTALTNLAKYRTARTIETAVKAVKDALEAV